MSFHSGSIFSRFSSSVASSFSAWMVASSSAMIDFENSLRRVSEVSPWRRIGVGQDQAKARG
jgi:hypothetical protein